MRARFGCSANEGVSLLAHILVSLNGAQECGVMVIALRYENLASSTLATTAVFISFLSCAELANNLKVANKNGQKKYFEGVLD